MKRTLCGSVLENECKESWRSLGPSALALSGPWQARPKPLVGRDLWVGAVLSARLEKLLSVLEPFELKEKIEKKLRVILRREARPSPHKAP